MTPLQDAQRRYIAPSTAISHTFDPTDQQWDELDAAAAEYQAASQAEADARQALSPETRTKATPRQQHRRKHK